ncbi:hypothetical protein V7S43_011358 [Phytophthora oleae]|uniref:Purple acid phosphatase C-terminal domain-containing protein n=1 Tax=Phytophthora oleae TaxID=2107226 RepID=A0ABD3FEP8_9STRA
MHRPIYDLSTTKNGVPVEQSARIQAAFEALFIKYKVDVVLTAHEHCYECHTPIRNNSPVLDGVSSDRKTYSNPQAPVYILSGAGGGIEGHENNPHTSAKWNVMANYADFGVTTLEENRTVLSWKFINSVNQAVLDSFVVRKV